MNMGCNASSPAGSSAKKALVEKFKTSAWDGSYKEDVTEDAVMVHGGQTMPIDAFFGWCSAVGMAKAFPDWVWTNVTIEELPDGRLKVGTQQTTGKLKGDIPAIGPFPEIKLAEVPADSLLLTAESGAILPVEVGYYTFNSDLKLTKIDYPGELGDASKSNTMSFTPPVGPPLLYAMAGKPLPPPPPAAPTEAEPEVVAMLEKFCTFTGDSAALATEDCLMNPPGAPPMPMAQVLGMMEACKVTFPGWVSRFHGAVKNADGTYSVLTQQCLGPMQADFPAMGPFPFVALDSVPDVLKTEDLANPVEVGTFTLSEDRTKVKAAAYALTSHLDLPIEGFTGRGSASVEAVWGKKGDGSDVGFGAYFTLMGVPLPPPPPPPKGYAMTFCKITDGKMFKEEYLPALAPTVKAFDGKFKFRMPTKNGGPLGEAAPHVERDTAADYDIAVLIEFPSLEKAMAWNSSPEYVAAAKIRRACLAGPFAVFEGAAGVPAEIGALQLLWVKVTDPAKFQEYLAGFGPSLTQDGKTYGFLAGRAMLPEAPFVEPDAAEAFTAAVVVGFNSLEDFHTWHDSDIYTKLAPLRMDGTTGPSVAGPAILPAPPAA